MTSTRIVGGSLWMIAMRWSMRSIGLVSTIILARLLTPDDFGLVAMAYIVVGLLQVLADAGVDLALLRDRNSTTAHWNSAWTIQVMQGALVSVMLLLAVQPSVLYFDEPRVSTALLALSICPFIDGFRNIGTVAFRKELDFAREFRFQVAQKLATFIAVVSLAFLLKNYWAIIFARIIASFTGVAISYAMHEYRPRFTLERVRDIWSFSQWMLLSRIGEFGNGQTDKFIVGGTAGTSSMGDYHVAKEVASMLSAELIYPVRRALFPNFAILVAEQQKYTQTVVTMLSIAASLIMAVQFGLAAVANDFVAVILGDRWLGITPVLQILSFAVCAKALTMLLEFLLPLTNQTRIAALTAWAELAVLILVLLYLQRTYGTLESLAYGRLVIAIVFVPVMFAVIARYCHVPFTAMLAAIWRPLIAATIMYFTVRWLVSGLVLDPLLRLPVTVAAG
ncbi:MAG: oligosaccharide flippase family protein, partial [Gammaproteobacteria bacterium]|nr:oligosaccharide flippase family protein [Gammaproteobacteria bacterium]